MESFRNFVRGWVGKAFLAIVIIVFVVFAFAPQFTPPGGSGEVAVVNDYKIGKRELDQAVESAISRIAAQVDRKVAEQLVQPDRVLESLIRQRIQVDAAARIGLVAHPQFVQESIMSVEAFQGEDGKFSQERFQQVILASGFAGSVAFRKRVEENILSEQFTGAIRDSAFSTGQEIELLTRIGNQTRDIAWILLSPAGFMGSVQPTPEEMKQRYEGNPALYMSEERFAIDYVELKSEDFMAKSVVDESTLRAKYDEMVGLARQNAERRVAHILIAKSNRSDEEARARAAEVMEHLGKGASFADLAGKYSDDPGSAGKGGDLGYVARGVFDPALDAAVQAIKVGDVSNPVSTPDGLHIVKILDERQPSVPSFGEARAELTAGLVRSEALRQFAEALDELGTLAYESDSLQEPAGKVGLTVQSTGLFGRTDAPPVVATNPKVMEALRSPEVMEDGRNSAPVKLSDEHVVILRLREHEKPRRLSFEEASASVRLDVLREKAAALAREKALGIKTAIEAGKLIDDVARNESLPVSRLPEARRRSPDISPELLKAVFAAKRPVEGKATVGSVVLSDGSEAVFTVSSVTDGNLLGVSEEERKMLLARLGQEFGQVEFSRLLEQATKDADIVRLLGQNKAPDDSFSVLGALQELRGKYQDQRHGNFE